MKDNFTVDFFIEVSGKFTKKNKDDCRISFSNKKLKRVLGRKIFRILCVATSC